MPTAWEIMKLQVIRRLENGNRYPVLQGRLEYIYSASAINKTIN